LRFGIAWDEIEWVRCAVWESRHGAAPVSLQLYSRNGGIGLDLGGPYREADEPALEGIAAAIAVRLGLPARWYADLQKASPARGPLTVWARTAPPPVHADDRGLWCNEFDQFTEWGRIAQVAACKTEDGALTVGIDVGITRPGDLLDIHDANPGFAECMRALTARLPGMPAEWLDEARALPLAGSTTVWQRTHPEGYPRLYADDLGVCREDVPDHPFDLAWEAIDRVLGHSSDGRIEIELESMDGIRVLLRSDWEGFADVMCAMPSGLPGLPPGRLRRIAQLQPGHALWRRGWSIASEEIGLDGMLVTTWQRTEA
jgi:hypothetical protein